MLNLNYKGTVCYIRRVEFPPPSLLQPSTHAKKTPLMKIKQSYICGFRFLAWPLIILYLIFTLSKLEILRNPKINCGVYFEHKLSALSSGVCGTEMVSGADVFQKRRTLRRTLLQQQQEQNKVTNINHDTHSGTVEFKILFT